MSTQSRIEGGIFGLAIGDAFGAPYEGGPLERWVWRAIGKTRDGKRRWTDDTQMSLDLATSLIENRRIDQDAIAKRFSDNYHWSRGYGPGAAKVLKRIKRGSNWQAACRSVYPDGSYGNGAAMRSPVIGFGFHRDMEQIDHAAKQVAEITHAHPLAIDGARLIAHSAALACVCANSSDVWESLISIDCVETLRAKLQLAHQWVETGDDVPVDEIRKKLGNGIATAESVVTSIYIGLTHAEKEFDELLKTVIHVGGDTDTIAAMSGSLWGALRGVKDLPSNYQSELESEALIRKTAIALFEFKFSS